MLENRVWEPLEERGIKGQWDTFVSSAAATSTVVAPPPPPPAAAKP